MSRTNVIGEKRNGYRRVSLLGAGVENLRNAAGRHHPAAPAAPLPTDSGIDDEGGVGRRASIASVVSADDGHEERESFLASAINLDAIAAAAPEPAKPEPAVPDAAVAAPLIATPEPRAKRRRRA